ncbi:hypothetical protein LPE509_00650 [Legionella pneumophila subsp. pneumophila LPE509]|nr:hypothetical protein LPE509_00650 [Legionella pneumophila subsp. pneumophila LPE509]
MFLPEQNQIHLFLLISLIKTKEIEILIYSHPTKIVDYLSKI